MIKQKIINIIKIIIISSIINCSEALNNNFHQDEFSNFAQKSLLNKKICLVQNRGNAGDLLIWYGTICLFNKIGLSFKIASCDNDIISKDFDAVIYSGGGNLVPYYNTCENFLKKYMQQVKQLIILPHSIKGHKDLLLNLPKNTIIFCREFMSYDYCKKTLLNVENVFFSQDMAFYSDLSKYKYQNNLNKKDKKIKELFAFRQDSEKNKERAKIKLPESNKDISSMGKINTYSSFEQNMKTLNKFILQILPYDTIWTDRLHVAIAAFLLDKKVHLFDNSYGKNLAVYESTIKYLDKNKNVIFHGNNFSALINKIKKIES